MSNIIKDSENGKIDSIAEDYSSSSDFDELMEEVGYSKTNKTQEITNNFSDDMFDDSEGFSAEELSKLESLAHSEQFRVG